jgi:uncharacterized repeat protein (TIGR01451 family)
MRSHLVIAAAAWLLATPGIGQAQSGEIGNFCVQDYQPGAGCTANDVRIEALTVVSVVEDCLTGVVGETEVVFETLVSSAGSPDRYDVGLFLALDGGSALSGDVCYHDYLDPPLTPTPVYGDKNGDLINDLDGGPWWDGDTDTCGDIESNTQVFKTLPALRFACIDANGDGSADVSVCTSWDNNAGTLCSSVVDAFPGTNSKCSCADVELGIPPEPAITIVKTPPLQYVLAGGSATFTFTVTSTTWISNVVVTDAPACDTMTGPAGDTNGDSILQPTETWTYTCTINNVTADFTDTVTVTGDGPLGPVSDSDTADVIVQSPGITVSKTPPTQVVLTGGTATFTVTATNSGNVDLDPVSISDPQCTTLTGPTGDDGDGILNPAEAWDWTCTVTNVTADFTNTATVTGTPPTGPPVSDSDGADVTVEAPGITVSKTPPTQVVLTGGTATFTVTATNSGNVDLDPVSISDPQCTTLTGPTGDDGDGILNPAESWDWTCTVTNVTAGFTNTATVTGTPPSGPDVSDNDSADVVVDAPAIGLSKTPATQTVAVGGTATFTLTAVNTGNADLDPVSISDPQFTTLTGPTGDDGDGILNPAESWDWTCTVTNVTAGFTNTATVTGTPPLGPPVTDNDSADVTVDAQAPLIVADKGSALLPLGDTDDSGTLTPGDVLTYTVVIENQGAGDALNVVFDDTPDVNTSLVTGTVTTTQGTIIMGNTAGDTSLSVAIGTMPASASVTITFEAQINNPLPEGVREIINQGEVSGENFPPVLTNDPDTNPGGDPTIDVLARQAAIPTLSQWGVILFVMLLAAAAIFRLRQL